MSTDNRTAYVAARTRAGWSAARIAAELGCSERTVQRHRRTAGVAQLAPRPLTVDQWRRASELLDDGAPYTEAAATVGCCTKVLSDRFPGKGWTPAQAWDMRRAMGERW